MTEGRQLYPQRAHIGRQGHRPAKLLNGLLWLLLGVVGSASANCHEAVAEVLASPQTMLDHLQPCVLEAGLLGNHSLVVDRQHSFVSAGIGSTPQALDLKYTGNFMQLAPGASIQIVSAVLQGVQLLPPDSGNAFHLAALLVEHGAGVRLQDVTIVTDCASLIAYKLWMTQQNLTSVQVSPSGDLWVASLLAGAFNMSAVNITCHQPQILLQDASRTVVAINDDIDLYNALALAHAYPAGAVELAIRVPKVSLTSSLWSTKGVNVLRNVSILPDVGEGGNVATVDLNDLVYAIRLGTGVFVVVHNVTFINLALVNGFSPIPFTGLGLVSMFAWAFQFPRSLTNRTTEQLHLVDCELVVYADELTHMLVWTSFVTTTTGPLVAEAVPFRIGIRDLVVESNQGSPILQYSSFVAYGVNMTRVKVASPMQLDPSPVLTSRPPLLPLYLLGLPVSTTVVGVWSERDIRSAFSLLQGLSGCSPYATNTLYLQFFANVSLDAAMWSGNGYNTSCNVTLAGVPGHSGGTWLDVGLVPHVINLGPAAFISFRNLVLVNMPTKAGVYNLNALETTTSPLWFVRRPTNNTLQAHILLHSCMLVLPDEESDSLADATAAPGANATDHSPALHQSILSFQRTSTPSAREYVMLDALVGLEGIEALGLNITGTDTLPPPFPVLIPDGVYGTAGPERRRRSGSSAGGGSDSSSALVIGLAVALPVAALLAAVAGVMLYRRRAAHRARSADSGNSNYITHKESNATDSKGDARLVDLGPGDSEAGSVARPVNTPKSGSKQDEEAVAAGSEQKTEDSTKQTQQSNVVAQPMKELQSLIMDLADQIKDKHLTVLGPIGSGGFATVYKGTWRGIDVAVKVIEFQDRNMGDEKLQTRALTEVAICANIQHDNIVTTFSFDIKPVHPTDDQPDRQATALLGINTNGGVVAQSTQGDPGPSSEQVTHWKLYLIQEFCELGSLRVALEQRLFQQPDGYPNLPGVLRVGLDVIDGLLHLHKKNIIHGDLTPGNVLLRPSKLAAGQYVSKLCDFGLSVKMQDSQTTVENMRRGTPFYASPEVRHHGNLTKASDVYAFGIILWELYYGRPCYQRVRGAKNYVYAAGFPNFPPQCPGLYAQVAAACMRKAPAERPPLVNIRAALQQLLDALLAAAAAAPAVAAAPDPPPAELEQRPAAPAPAPARLLVAAEVLVPAPQPPQPAAGAAEAMTAPSKVTAAELPAEQGASAAEGGVGEAPAGEATVPKRGREAAAQQEHRQQAHAPAPEQMEERRASSAALLADQGTESFATPDVAAQTGPVFISASEGTH